MNPGLHPTFKPGTTVFKPGRLYRHEKCITVAMEVLKAFYIKEKNVWSLKIRWWKISSTHEPRCMAPGGDWDERIRVPLEKVNGWKIMGWTARGPAFGFRELTFEQGRIQENPVGK